MSVEVMEAIDMWPNAVYSTFIIRFYMSVYEVQNMGFLSHVSS
jgi:hypothetical protein